MVKGLSGVLVLALCGAPAPASAAVVINEVGYDPAGSDTGLEWIELYNDGPSAVPVTGWSIQRDVNGVWTDTTTAGSFFLIEETESATPAPGDFVLPGTLLALSNAGSKADGFRLLDASGAEVDRLVYGSPDSDGIGAEGGAGREAAAVRSGSSLARITDGRDRQNNRTDFAEDATPTPRARNDPLGVVAEQCLSVPNPFTPATQTHVTFTTPESLLTPPFHEVRIYNVAGELVRTLKAFQWDGRNDFGDLVSTGLYFYAFETEGGKRRGRVTVIR
jgi:hypothetical protein